MADSGQKTVAAAGTAEVLGTITMQAPMSLRALEGNAGNVFVGNDGSNDVSSTTGFELAPGDMVIFDYVGRFSSIYVDVAVNGDGVVWERVNV